MKSKKTHSNNDTLNETETRKRLVADCMRRFGPEGVRQLTLLFEKWDKIIINCKNDNELKHMRAMASAEIYSALGYSGGLTVGGQVIIPAESQLLRGQAPEPASPAVGRETIG